MSISIQALTDAVSTTALKLGVFERVNGHEPKSAPGNGITAAIWADSLQPIRASGLNSTSVRLTFNVRLFTSMLTEPQDAIDPEMVRALDAFMAAVTGDFTLGGLVRSVDLLGAHGPSLSAQAGYVQQDNRLFRVFTVILPLIINDSWEQVA